MPHPAVTTVETQHVPEADIVGGAIAFVRASYQYREKMRQDAWTLSTSQQVATPLAIIPGRFRRARWIEVANPAVGAVGTAVLGQPSDWPFSLIASLTLEDVNGQAIVGPLSGYFLSLLHQYGRHFSAW